MSTSSQEQDTLDVAQTEESLDTMSTAENFRKFGEELGLSGKSLADFVIQQQSLEREERVRRREHERVIAELDLRRTELENKTASLPSTVSNASNVGPMPKLPKFNSDKDDIDSYLWRSEVNAKLRGWPQSSWATYLGALLEGKGLEVYARLPPDHAQDYNALKKALLIQFQMTKDGFKAKFHTSRQSKEETFSQYVSRTSNFFDRWLDLSEVPSTFEALRDFVILERCLHNSAPELVTFVREHDVKVLSEAVSKAEIFETAHNAKRSNSNRDRFKSGSNPGSNKVPAPKGPGQASSSQSQGNSSKPGFKKEQKRCYRCGSPNHFKRDCKGQLGNAAVAEDQAE